jgi:serine kinase of HPr protein (carbohydrate metabolism regulator)
MEALNSLCNDYEELDDAYKSYEGMREQTRDQISTVMVRVADKVEIKGFGVLTMMAPQAVEIVDKSKLKALIYELIDEGEPAIADRIRSCIEKRARVGSLRIEREKAPR